MLPCVLPCVSLCVCGTNRLCAMRPPGQETTKITQNEPVNEEEEVDIDLTDPDVENAAVKIQAGFKGFKARKEAKNKVGQLRSLEVKLRSLGVISQYSSLSASNQYFYLRLCFFPSGVNMEVAFITCLCQCLFILLSCTSIS